MRDYDYTSIEKKWRKYWADNKTFKVSEDEKFPKNKRLFVLDMFPYPSGAGLHVGHPEGYTATDIYSRFKKMNGYNVLHPMGFDAFGLPAENYAIKTGTHPAETTYKNIDNFRNQIQSFGFCYDWDREIATCDKKYYKWTQWIFLQLFKKGLAYESKIAINWCPSCLTGLANEEVKDGKCERCGTTIERRRIRQWMLKITAYADRLLEDLDELDWNDSIKLMQKNWIGRSEGAEIDFPIAGFDEKLKVFTTRPDTLYGATYMVVAPEHPLVSKITTADKKAQVDSYIAEAAKKSDLQRTDLNKEKTGVFTGSYAINPINNKKIPIWISDYVLIDYGTGAIMAVPAHDDRDFDFAKKFNIPIIQVIAKDGKPIENMQVAYTEASGTMINSGEWDGKESAELKKLAPTLIEQKGFGKKTINYKLRDWVFSRQRYWGEPFPIVHCPKCGIVALDEKDLPLRLPNVKSYKPTGTGESPLEGITDWVNTTCPKCGGPAKRETNTMPQWAGSCWYYLRYMDPHNDNEIASQNAIKYWEPVNLYVGGAEHAVLHLLYARFWHKFLYDLGIVHTKEPFHALRNQGMILGENGEKMSKSRGNVINPDDVIEQHGADTLRMYEMFMGPLNVDKPWNTQSIFGVRRFLERVWRLLDKKIVDGYEDSLEVQKAINKTIKLVTEKIEVLDFNTAISQMMILLNTLQKEETISKQTMKNFVLIMHPFAPFITEEMWQELGGQPSVLNQPWPTWDSTKIEDDTVTVVYQINGKVRSKAEVSKDLTQDQLIELALNDEKIKQLTAGKQIIKKIAVPSKLVNIVVK